MRNPLVRLIVLLVCLSFVASCTHVRETRQDADTPAEPALNDFGLPLDSFRCDTLMVKSGMTLSTVFKQLGCEPTVLYALNLLKKNDFDARCVQADKPFIAFYTTTTTNDTTRTNRKNIRHIVYLPNKIDYYLFHLTDSLYVEKKSRPVRVEDKVAHFVIESGLWNAMTDNNLPGELSSVLSDIYAWTIDFFGLQRGDSVSVSYTENYVGSEMIGIDKVYASLFWHRGTCFRAYRFEKDTIRSYFDETGKSLHKTFLKAPLQYKRISSRFTYARRHPIHKVVRPHTGVDYAAPAGTPVQSIGNGTVIERKYDKGGGNMVKIKHNSTYTTAYLHLSRFATGIHVRSKVKQGQTIGYVGSTGHSTGPHLDFRVWKNGTPVNPLKMQSPPALPLPEVYKTEFDSIVHYYDSLLTR